MVVKITETCLGFIIEIDGKRCDTNLIGLEKLNKFLGKSFTFEELDLSLHSIAENIIQSNNCTVNYSNDVCDFCGHSDAIYTFKK